MESELEAGRGYGFVRDKVRRQEILHTWEGDIAFPCILTASVYFAQGMTPAVVMAVFGLLGLASAYAIQAIFLKGKPIPALPPIAVFTLVGLLIIS